MTRQIVVEIVGDDKKLTGTLREATGKVEGFGGRLKNVGKGLAIGAGVAGFNLLTNAISLGVSKLDEMHQAFLDSEAAQARLQVALENSVSNVEEATTAVKAFGESMIDLGFADEDVFDSVSQLVGVTHDYTEAIRLATLAGDLARAKNIDLAAATDAVQKGYLGQARALQALGIDLRGAAGGAQILDRTFKNVNGAMQTFASTSAGKVERANARMGETMEKVGGAIDAVSQIVIPLMVDGLSELVDIAGDIIAVFVDLVTWTENLATSIMNVATAATTAQGPLGALLNIGKSVLGALPGGQFLGLPPAAGPAAGTGITVNRGINIGVPGWPTFHQGGVVPGTPGTEVLARLQAGETVTPRGQSGGQTIIVNIASFIGSDRDIDRFSDRLAFRLRSTSLS
jgi:hypothetical protein